MTLSPDIEQFVCHRGYEFRVIPKSGNHEMFIIYLETDDFSDEKWGYWDYTDAELREVMNCMITVVEFT